jgi:multidrug efflux system membrane fusion protein
MQGPDGAYAYVIKPDDTVERRDISIAMTQRDLAVIDKGISAGDRVVLDGQYRLTQGAKVQVRGTSAHTANTVASRLPAASNQGERPANETGQ